MYHCQRPCFFHIMTQLNVLPIVPHKAVSQVPRFPTCPSLMNRCDIGVPVDVRPQDFGFVRDLICNKLAYVNGCEHVYLHYLFPSFLWIFGVESYFIILLVFVVLKSLRLAKYTKNESIYIPELLSE